MIDAQRQRVETSLVQRAQAGDEHAMADLLRLSRPLVERTVARHCWDCEMRDDLTQSILLVALTELSELRNAQAYVNWLQRIARNLCCKQARDAARACGLQAHGSSSSASLPLAHPPNRSILRQRRSETRSRLT